MDLEYKLSYNIFSLKEYSMHLSEELKKMNITDKFTMMEQLWEDMSENIEDDRFSPNWHLDILNEREKNIENNSSKFDDLDDVKKRLLKKTLV